MAHSLLQHVQQLAVDEFGNYSLGAIVENFQDWKEDNFGISLRRKKETEKEAEVDNEAEDEDDNEAEDSDIEVEV